jgi:type II secretory pathway predicted ATPase ExeA
MTTKNLKLHSIMREHSLSCRALAQACKAPYRSASTINQLALHGAWPKSIPRNVLQAQIERALITLGVSREEAKNAWQLELPSVTPAPKPTHDDDFYLPETEMLTDAAMRHFKLVRDPFLNEIRTDKDFYESQDQQRAFVMLMDAAENCGLMALIGESGAGKSTLRSKLLETIKREDKNIRVIQVQCVDKEKLNAQHICDAIIAELTQESPKLSMEAKSRQVLRILTDASKASLGSTHVLIIEEAHLLTNAALRHIKSFWEMQDGIRRLLGVILLGQPELDDKLTERKNYAVRELIRRCRKVFLLPLDGQVGAYIAHKLLRAGVKSESVFEEDVPTAVQARLTRARSGSDVQESHVHPLAVNNLITAAMNRAVALGQAKVSAALVRSV